MYLGFILLFSSACNKDFGTGELIDYTNTVKTEVDNNPKFSMFKELYQLNDSLVKANQGTVNANTRSVLIGPTLGTPFITAFIPTNDAFISRGVNFIKGPNGTLNTIFFRGLIKRDTSVRTLSTLDVAAFLGNLIHSRPITQSAFIGSDVSLKTLTLVAVDSLYILNLGDRYSILGMSDLDLPGIIKKKNGNLIPINNLITPVYNGSYLQYLAIDSSLTLFNQAVVRAASTLVTNSSNIVANRTTLFAPTNQAMREAGYTTISINATSVAILRTLVETHVINQRLFTTRLTNNTLNALNAREITVNVLSTTNTTLKTLNTPIAAKITSPNIPLARTVVHKIDKVLRP